jgi:hypothetical protein
VIHSEGNGSLRDRRFIAIRAKSEKKSLTPFVTYDYFLKEDDQQSHYRHFSAITILLFLTNGGEEAYQGNGERLGRLAVHAERGIARRRGFTGTSPISGDYRHTAVRRRFSVWKQSADFRGSRNERSPKSRAVADR